MPLEAGMSTDHVRQAIRLIKAGQRALAREVLEHALERDPADAAAWLWMSEVVEDSARKRRCLENCLRIEPQNKLARRGLMFLSRLPSWQTGAAIPPAPTEPPPVSPAPEQSPLQPPTHDEPPVTAADFEPTPPTPEPASNAPGTAPHQSPRRYKTAAYLAGSIAAAAILLLVAIAVNALLLVPSSREAALFQQQYQAFLAEGHRMDIMTQQGVSYTSFRQQLVEVKAAYTQLDGSWPESFSARRALFDKAIAGWDLTLQVWDFGMERRPGYLSIVWLEQDDPLLLECARYVNVEDIEYAQIISVEEWIGILMAQASQYFASASPASD